MCDLLSHGYCHVAMLPNRRAFDAAAAGPCSQLKTMFDDTRRIATIIFLSAIVATISFALIPGIPNKTRVLLIIISCVTQLLAWIWCLN